MPSIPFTLESPKPNAIPMTPISIELPTWPTPHSNVIIPVLTIDHFLAFDITINGR